MDRISDTHVHLDMKKKLGIHTSCRKCGRQDVDNTIDFRRVEDSYATLEIAWVCNSCFDNIKRYTGSG